KLSLMDVLIPIISARGRVLATGGPRWAGCGGSCGPYPASAGSTCVRFPGHPLRGVGSMVDDHCIFCRIIGGEEMVSIVHEDDRAIAFMDIQPASPGHTLVVSRDHYPT